MINTELRYRNMERTNIVKCGILKVIICYVWKTKNNKVHMSHHKKGLLSQNKKMHTVNTVHPSFIKADF